MKSFGHLVGHELRQHHMLALGKLIVKVLKVAFASELLNEAAFLQVLEVQEVQELHDMRVGLSLDESCSLCTKDDFVGLFTMKTSRRNDFHGEDSLIPESLDLKHGTETASSNALLDLVLELVVAKRLDGCAD